MRIDPSCDQYVKLELYGYSTDSGFTLPAPITDASVNIVNLWTKQIVAKDLVVKDGKQDMPLLCKNQMYNITICPAKSREESFDCIQTNSYIGNSDYSVYIPAREAS
jgi:hypothetical protein